MVAFPRTASVAIALTTTVLALGCSESPTSTPGRQVPQAGLAGGRPARPPHPDEVMANIADRVPGFAGFYMRGASLVLRVKATEANALTADALRQVLRADPDVRRFHGWVRALAEAPVELEGSRYDARELWAFRLLALREVFGHGVHQLDLDERQGAIRLGVADARDVNAVAGRVKAAGIPPDAVVIDVREQAQPEATLRDRLRPVPGGVQIDVENGGGCTLTANAWRPESEAWMFLTNSHCTSMIGGANGEAAYQNTVGYGNIIGWEFLDPALWEPGSPECPDTVVIGPGPGDSIPVLGCRYTDAAAFVYGSSGSPDSTTIARTQGWLGSLTIDPYHPRFAVGETSYEFPSLGMEVHKIGRTTGWTKGEVTATCQDIFAPNDRFMRFCSYLADYSSDNGDSGSPVFTWDGSSFAVQLVGIHWGRTGNGPRYFNPWLFITIEIDGELMEEVIWTY